MEGSLAEEEEEEEEELRDLVSDSEGGLGSELCVSPTAHTHTYTHTLLLLSHFPFAFQQISKFVCIAKGTYTIETLPYNNTWN